jgi:diketogulonate reductase-like aldo/keto reductase
VVLRWLTQRDVVIPKSVRPERMAENLDIFDFTLTDEQMGRIAVLDRARRCTSITVTRRWWPGRTAAPTPDRAIGMGPAAGAPVLLS